MTQRSNGAYYSYESVPSGISGKTIIGVFLNYWANCPSAAVPYVYGDHFGFMSATSQTLGRVSLSFIYLD